MPYAVSSVYLSERFSPALFIFIHLAWQLLAQCGKKLFKPAQAFVENKLSSRKTRDYGQQSQKKVF